MYETGGRENLQESGNLVQYTDCVFSENSALLYGGTIGMILSTSAILFQDRKNILPVEINSWWVNFFFVVKQDQCLWK